MYSFFDCADKKDISVSKAKKRLTTVASIVPGLHCRLIPLLDNHHTSILVYRPTDKHLNQGMKRCD